MRVGYIAQQKPLDGLLLGQALDSIRLNLLTSIKISHEASVEIGLQKSSSVCIFSAYTHCAEQLI